ncbi:MAG: amidinotransferase, partial [Candidatus Omnitrophica bacterium]|nr:amidinotransferase [Candidatus Omnitrophota bacterium]
MCRPTYYAISYEINPWMRVARPASARRALRQWEALYRLLTQRLKIRVRLLPPKRGLPDLTFTANAGLVHGRTLIRSNFRYPQRQKEEPVIEQAFRRWGFRIARLPSTVRFEGEGDALWLGGSLLLGFRFRSDAPAHGPLSTLLQREVLPVELADDRFYHLDTCCCPLPGGAVLWYPKAFDRYGRRVIEQLATDTIPVSRADALKFCCNAIATPEAIVLHRGISASLRT